MVSHLKFPNGVNAEIRYNCGHGIISSQYTFMFTCKGLCGGGNLWDLGQGLPNEAPYLLSAASATEALTLSVWYSGMLYKISCFERMLFMLPIFFLYTGLWYLRVKICRICRSPREQSPNLVFLLTVWLCTNYLTYVWVSASLSVKSVMWEIVGYWIRLFPFP